MVNIPKQRKRLKRKGVRKRLLQNKNLYFHKTFFCKKIDTKKKWLIKIQKGISLSAQAISCPNLRGVFPVHELFWFCLVQVSTTQFCSFPSFLMARASDGTVMPISPAPASSSNMGSPDGSLPDLEGTGFRASTMEEKITEIYLQLPLFIQNAARIENCVQTLAQTVAAQTTKITKYWTNCWEPCRSRHFFGNKCSFWFQWPWFSKIFERAWTE